VQILLRRDLLRYYWIFDMHSLSYRIVIVFCGIVMHTMCQRYLLLDGRISVHIMRGRDVLRYYWIFDMHSLSYRIVIVSWCIIVHTNTNKLSKRILLLRSRICVHAMLGRDIY
jgi:hypothetical protein